MIIDNSGPGSLNVRVDVPLDGSGYETFVRCKTLQSYTVIGRTVWTDDISYRQVFGGDEPDAIDVTSNAAHLMPFQADLANRAIARRRFAIFADCGLGKTPTGLAWAVSVAEHGRVLILCPLAVIEQWKREAKRWHGIELADLRKGDKWESIAISNFERRCEIDTKGLMGVVLDESSILKNPDGETMKWLMGVRENVPYRLALSATPAPNSHYEYASHAAWLGISPSVKEYCSRYMKKDGVKWVLRGHAIGPFYENISSWATYIQSPRSLGYTETTEMPCEPDYLWTRTRGGDVEASDGSMFATIERSSDRSKVMGELRSSDNDRMRCIVDWSRGKRCIVWVARNSEEAAIASRLEGDVAVINGKMPIGERVRLVDAYRAGEIDHIVSKPKVLGFGVNIPECDHMIYSGFTYSFEEFYQAVRRAHRYGRTGRLEVLVPYTPEEAPMLSTLRSKMDRFQDDVTEIQARFWGAHD